MNVERLLFGCVIYGSMLLFSWIGDAARVGTRVATAHAKFLGIGFFIYLVVTSFDSFREHSRLPLLIIILLLLLHQLVRIARRRALIGPVVIAFPSASSGSSFHAVAIGVLCAMLFLGARGKAGAPLLDIILTISCFAGLLLLIASGKTVELCERGLLHGFVYQWSAFRDFRWEVDVPDVITLTSPSWIVGTVAINVAEEHLDSVEDYVRSKGVRLVNEPERTDDG